MTKPMKLENVLQAWGSPDFENTLKQEIGALDHSLLPLQQGLARSSHVSDSDIEVTILSVGETGTHIRVKAGILYAGVIAGSCCADDPTPLDEQPEYCELVFDIDRYSGEALVSIAAD